MASTGNEDDTDEPPHPAPPRMRSLFVLMTHKRWMGFFLLTLPVLWAIFIGVGWSMDDKIEEEVYNIWTRQRSEFAQDKEYAAEFDRDTLGATSFAAMAIARDGGNLFDQWRLEEIRQRMEDTEGTTITYNGNEYTWDDVCASNDIGLGTAYKFPCVRLSPMDYFQEARWFFQEEDRVTWYNEVVRKLVIAPRIPRFGILDQVCSNLTVHTDRTECDDVILNRMLSGEPMLLFADIGNLENNNPCKQCIEDEYEATITNIHGGALQLFQGFQGYATATGQTDLVEKYTNVLENLDRQAVVDFYSYSVTRGLYASLGAKSYADNKDLFNQMLCTTDKIPTPPPCPPPTTIDEAEIALKAHADHAFSSDVTAGNPLPLWGDDGEGSLNPFVPGSPVGGSGVDLSGTPFSSAGTLAVMPPAPIGSIEGDPVYAWFMAAETPMTGHCGNGYLKGTEGFGDEIDAWTAGLMMAYTAKWCTKFNEPFEVSEELTVQHFARMWYDLLVDSPNFLNLVQGESDPYTWTTGQGCGYDLGGERSPFENSDTNSILANASGELYYIDEGESVGAIDKSLLMGGVEPEDYNVSNPLEKVSVFQSIYPALLPEDIVDRVKNCNRPNGPLDIDVEDAEEILHRFKKKFEDTWAKDWDDETAGNVSFVGFFDDTGVVGTTGRMLKDITLDNGTLIIVSIVIIGFFSVLFVFTLDIVDSTVILTGFGVGLVVFAFFAAVSFGLICGIKINITIAWTLPFIMLGLGVDDMYIVLLALKRQPGYELKDFLAAMKEVIVPISMTSVVNASMFAIMNINDIPAVYLTAQVALISVIFLYITIVFCFAAWCYLDMRRQADGRYDGLFWMKREMAEVQEKGYLWASCLYDYLYKPLVCEWNPVILVVSHLIIWLIAGVLLGLGIWGLTESHREIGLGLEDFFPEDNQASRWATMRTEELASWSIQLNWGAVDYSNPDNQMRVIKQFEDVVGTDHVAEVDTKKLWLADFVVWTTHQCTENFDRENPETRECGFDQAYPGEVNSTCTGIWKPNSLGLREKNFVGLDDCAPFEGGICRPSSEMHPDDALDGIGNADQVDSWCPVVEGWSDDKLQFCLGKWREITGGGGRLVLQNATGTPTECDGEFLDDELVAVPVPYSAGPTMFAFDLFSHEITIDMIEETRAICDDDPDIHCWLEGIPYNYWSQYIEIYNTFWKIGGTSVAVGFGVSFLFLVIKLMTERVHSLSKILIGSFIGAFLIAVTTMVSLVAVSGLSALFDVSFTGFSAMSFVLSVGFAVEYSVHIVARWLRAKPSLTNSLDRVEHTMSFLFLPTFMSFVSSTIGVACLAFTKFEFNQVFFFRPLIIVMFVTYFYGCWWLPACLVCVDIDQVRLGNPAADDDDDDENVNGIVSPKGPAPVATTKDKLLMAEEPTEAAHDKTSDHHDDNHEEEEVASDEA